MGNSKSSTTVSYHCGCRSVGRVELYSKLPKIFQIFVVSLKSFFVYVLCVCVCVCVCVCYYVFLYNYIDVSVI